VQYGKHAVHSDDLKAVCTAHRDAAHAAVRRKERGFVERVLFPAAVGDFFYRAGEQVIVTTLGAISDDDHFVDMHSTVVVGGRESRFWKVGSDVKGIITPRGYDRKYVY
jgi:precorrin-3B methylase